MCHDNIVQSFQDARRVTTNHEAHQPPFVASPPAEPLPEPWEFFASNETGLPACFEALSLHLVSLAHPPDASFTVVEFHLVIEDPHLRNIHVLNSS
jgi:hypothetical protein